VFLGFSFFFLRRGREEGAPRFFHFCSDARAHPNNPSISPQPHPHPPQPHQTTTTVIFTIPFYDLVLVPLFKRLKRPITVTQRIGAGFVIQILALLMAGGLETARYRTAVPSVRALYEADGGTADTSSPDPLDKKYTQPMSIWVQFGPYYLLGAGEVFTNVGVIELFYVGVSSGMRSIGAAVYLLSAAL
jgi:hypothetical protein